MTASIHMRCQRLHGITIWTSLLLHHQCRSRFSSILYGVWSVEVSLDLHRQQSQWVTSSRRRGARMVAVAVLLAPCGLGGGGLGAIKIMNKGQNQVDLDSNASSQDW